MATIFRDLNSQIQIWTANCAAREEGSLLENMHANKTTQQKIHMCEMVHRFKLWISMNNLRRYDSLNTDVTVAHSAMVFRSLLISSFVAKLSSTRNADFPLDLFVPTPWALYAPDADSEPAVFNTRCVGCGANEYSEAAWHKSDPAKHAGPDCATTPPTPFKIKSCNYGVSNIHCSKTHTSKDGVYPGHLCGGLCLTKTVRVPALGPEHYASILLHFDAINFMPEMQKRFNEATCETIAKLVQTASENSVPMSNHFYDIIENMDNKAGTHREYTTFLFACSFVHPVHVITTCLGRAVQRHASRIRVWSDARTTDSEPGFLNRLFVRIDLCQKEQLFSFLMHVLGYFSDSGLSFACFQAIGVLESETTANLSPQTSVCSGSFHCKCAFDLVVDMRPRKHKAPNATGSWDCDV